MNCALKYFVIATIFNIILKYPRTKFNYRNHFIILKIIINFLYKKRDRFFQIRRLVPLQLTHDSKQSATSIFQFIYL